MVDLDTVVMEWLLVDWLLVDWLVVDWLLGPGGWSDVGWDVTTQRHVTARYHVTWRHDTTSRDSTIHRHVTIRHIATWRTTCMTNPKWNENEKLWNMDCGRWMSGGSMCIFGFVLFLFIFFFFYKFLFSFYILWCLFCDVFGGYKTYQKAQLEMYTAPFSVKDYDINGFHASSHRSKKPEMLSLGCDNFFLSHVLVQDHYWC